MDIIVLTGRVVHGKALGRTVGMPTANIQIQDASVLPECGVYVTRIQIGNDVYPAVTNIGKRPTVDDESHITVETFIIDFDEEIYGEQAVLEIHQFLRPIQKFNSLKEVKKQVEKDVERARIYFEEM